MVGWQVRDGAEELLARLSERFTLCLWSVGDRRYVERALSFGLARWFVETYTWDELPARWKDVRRIGAAYLIDDSLHHRAAAREPGIESAYILVPAYGSAEDRADPLGWVRIVEANLGLATDSPHCSQSPQ